ncbi:MAG: aldose 1-epimerase [Planctomycetota bacterium]
MHDLTLTAPGSGSTCTIAVDCGFNCYAFTAHVGGQTVDVIAAEDQFVNDRIKPSHSGIPLLAPFPNRIRDGKFTFDGRDTVLDPDVVGFNTTNAIHGFAIDKPWRVTERSEDSATGQFQLSVDAPERLSSWPADFLIEVKYFLTGATLRADVRIANPDDKPLPFGFGTHAYFQLPLTQKGSPATAVVQSPAAARWLLEDGLPTGETEPVDGKPGYDLRGGVPFADLSLDDVFTDVSTDDGVLKTVIREPESGFRIEQRTDDSFREIVGFTPPWCDAVCLEPYTCTTDAINLAERGIDGGLRVLGPGEEWRGWFEIEVD